MNQFRTMQKDLARLEQEELEQKRKEMENVLPETDFDTGILRPETPQEESQEIPVPPPSFEPAAPQPREAERETLLPSTSQEPQEPQEPQESQEPISISPSDEAEAPVQPPSVPPPPSQFLLPSEKSFSIESLESKPEILVPKPLESSPPVQIKKELEEIKEGNRLASRIIAVLLIALFLFFISTFSYWLFFVKAK